MVDVVVVEEAEIWCVVALAAVDEDFFGGRICRSGDWVFKDCHGMVSAEGGHGNDWTGSVCPRRTDGFGMNAREVSIGVDVD